jgi:phi13 family phage major tail protein
MGRSSINVKRLTMWEQLTDSETATTYGTDAHAFTNELNSAKYTPKTETASQYGDGVKVEDYVAKDGGDIDIVIRGFKQGDEAFLFGEKETTTEKTSISGSDDIVPYVCVAYMTERPDGKVNLYKFPKVKFMPQGEDSQQREGTKISYTTANIKGTYSPLLSSHADCYKCRGVDPGTQAELITKWFATAEFYTADSAVGG